MTIEEFDATGFSGGMMARYKGKAYSVTQVDFEEKLIGLDLRIMGADENSTSWVRCENCEIVVS